MPESKPLGAFSATENVATYTHAADITYAAEMDEAVGALANFSSFPVDLGSGSVTVEGSLSIVSAAAPHLRAISIDGTDIAVVPAITVGGTNQLSIGVIWRYTGASAPGNSQVWIGQFLGGTPEYGITFQGLTVGWAWDFGTSHPRITMPDPGSNVWTYWVAVYDFSAGTLTGYADGVSQGSISITSGSAQSGDVLLGNEGGGPAFEASSFRNFGDDLTSTEAGLADVLDEPYAVVGAVLPSGGATVGGDAPAVAVATSMTSSLRAEHGSAAAAVASSVALTSSLSAEHGAVASPVSISVTSSAALQAEHGSTANAVATSVLVASGLQAEHGGEAGAVAVAVTMTSALGSDGAPQTVGGSALPVTISTEMSSALQAEHGSAAPAVVVTVEMTSSLASGVGGNADPVHVVASMSSALRAEHGGTASVAALVVELASLLRGTHGAAADEVAVAVEMTSSLGTGDPIVPPTSVGRPIKSGRLRTGGPRADGLRTGGIASL